MGISQWGMMLNDTLGCCAIASVGHAIMSMTQAAGKLVQMTDAEVLKGYEAAGGYMPGQPDTDQGCLLSNVLLLWQINGYLAGGSAHSIQAWVQIDIADLEAIQFAIARLGVVSAGVAMTETAQQEFLMGEPWTTPTQDVEGGHAIPLIGYDGNSMAAVTWGRRQTLSYQWWETLGSEAYCLLDQDLAGAQGINWDALQAAMGEVEATLEQPATPPPATN